MVLNKYDITILKFTKWNKYYFFNIIILKVHFQEYDNMDFGLDGSILLFHLPFNIF